ncbi:MAG TPA: hypothetical protein VFO46_07760 [Candidatus Sulfotelmatobacter sp.]|nr:hypothetical protein [Candidatus Sulfotelmatobacter sp.]
MNLVDLFKLQPTINPGMSLTGYGYTAPLPPGFNAIPIDAFGSYCVIPPGSNPPPMSVAVILLSPVPPQAFPMVLQTYYNFENPMVALPNAYGLGLANILQVAPLRQSNMNGALAYIREFDAVSMNGQPMRMTAILLQGQNSSVQAVIGINVYQWTQFAASALQFVAGIQLAGTSQVPGEVRAFMQHQEASDVSLQIVGKDKSVTDVMTLPAEVEGKSVVFKFEGPVYFGDNIDCSNAEVSGNIQIGKNNTQSSRRSR